MLNGPYTLPARTPPSLAMHAAAAGGAFVFLLSIRAGGVGLNLQGADTVIMYDTGARCAVLCGVVGCAVCSMRCVVQYLWAWESGESVCCLF